MTETGREVCNKRNRGQYIPLVGQLVPMRDYERLKSLFPLHHLHFSPYISLLSPVPFLFSLFLRVRLYHSLSPLPFLCLRSPTQPLGPEKGPHSDRGTNHGNCSVEPTRQPALAFAFLLGAISRDPLDLPPILWPICPISPSLLSSFHPRPFSPITATRSRITSSGITPDRDLLMILIARNRGPDE